MRRDARQNEDAGADDRSDAEARELDGTQDAAQALLALKFFEENAVRLAHEQLVRHITPTGKTAQQPYDIPATPPRNP